MKRWVWRIALGIAALVALTLIVGIIWFNHRLAAAPNHVSVLTPMLQTSFRWLPVTAGGVVLPQGAMVVPVRLPGCDRIFHMQFDLGATSSLLYAGKLAALSERCPKLAMQDRDGKRNAANVSLLLNGQSLLFKEIYVRNMGGSTIDWNDTDHIEMIGTLGADIIEGKLLVIDYPRTTIWVGEMLPPEIVAPTRWGEFSFPNRRVMLRAAVDGKLTQLYFDTGSSAFELLTSPAIWEALAEPNAVPASLTVNSWGNALIVHRIKSEKRIDVAGASLPLGYVTKVDGASFAQNLMGRLIDMGGMTGNALFMNRVLVLDTRTGKAGLTGG
jgi:hypothetical protein